MNKPTDDILDKMERRRKRRQRMLAIRSICKVIIAVSWVIIVFWIAQKGIS